MARRRAAAMVDNDDDRDDDGDDGNYVHHCPPWAHRLEERRDLAAPAGATVGSQKCAATGGGDG